MAKKSISKKVASKTRGKGGRKAGKWNITRDAFRSWREAHKLSRGALGKRLGVSGTSIQNWEEGKSVPLLKHQHAISSAMNAGRPAPLPDDTDPLEAASMQLGLAFGRFLAVFASRMLRKS